MQNCRSFDMEDDASWEAHDTLLHNGMFRNRDYKGKPISGSNADFAYDDEEYREYAKLLGLETLPVHFAK